MARYFLEVAYKGTAYSGFQIQENANTVQAEIEKAFSILQRTQVILTGSSRTDTGVHALQNYFHFDFDAPVHEHFVYKMNAILPGDIVIKSLRQVNETQHCRYDAIWRGYEYHIYTQKDPFVSDRAYFFPYKVEMNKMQQAAAVLKEYRDFSSFSKRNTQSKTFLCELFESEWEQRGSIIVYKVQGNRFLRGMVRALTATMLKVGRGKLSIEDLRLVIEAKDCTKASFAVPGHGLRLVSVEYPEGYFREEKKLSPEMHNGRAFD